MKKIILASCLTVLLSACGGGGSSSGGETGGGGGTPVDPKLAVSLSSVPAEIDESSTLSITVSATGVKNTISSSIEVTDGNDIVTTNTSNPNQISITVPDVTVDQSFSFRVKVQDGDGETDPKRNYTSNLFTVNVVNSSFQVELSEIKFVSDSRDRIINQFEEIVVLSKLEQLNNYIDKSKQTGYNVNQSSEELEIAFDTLLLEEYLNGEVTEIELKERYNDLNIIINDYYLPYIVSINTNLQLLSNQTGLSSQTLESLTFNEELNSVSLFTGNTDFGSVVDGEWVFSSQFSYLTDLLNTDCSI